MNFFNPPGIAQPASRYMQAALVPAGGRRLVISGQVGARPDGTLEEGFEAQSRRAWSNLLAVIAHAGMKVTDLVKVTILVTEPGRTSAYRAVRDEVLAGHACCATYLQVAGLAHPDMLIEIEGEAVAA